MSAVIPIVGISTIEFFGDAQFKNYALTNNSGALFSGLYFYSFMIWIIILTLKSTKLVKMNAMWDGVSTIIATLLGIFILKESIDHKEALGIVLIILGLFALA